VTAAANTAKDTTVSAPGKLFLIGEYAVLQGHQAVVAAVDRRVTARFVPGAAPATPLAAHVIAAVRAYLLADGGTPPDGAPEMDSSALASGDNKLGLGSSAAAAAAGVGAMLEAAGCEIEYTLGLAMTLAHRAHFNLQDGVGSGADVAAAVHGGIIRFARRDRDVEVYPIALPDSLELIVFSTGKPSGTVGHIQALQAFATRQPGQYLERMQGLCTAADEFMHGCESEDARIVVKAAALAGAELAALGRGMDLAIVTPVFEEAARLAASLGGAAKPSGAGGGDVGVAFLTDQGAAETFRQRAPQLGLEILSIRTGADGLRREPSGQERNEVE